MYETGLRFRASFAALLGITWGLNGEVEKKINERKKERYLTHAMGKYKQLIRNPNGR